MCGSEPIESFFCVLKGNTYLDMIAIKRNLNEGVKTTWANLLDDLSVGKVFEVQMYSPESNLMVSMSFSHVIPSPHAIVFGKHPPGCLNIQYPWVQPRERDMTYVESGTRKIYYVRSKFATYEITIK
jgi:hypothetical protein